MRKKRLVLAILILSVLFTSFASASVQDFVDEIGNFITSMVAKDDTCDACDFNGDSVYTPADSSELQECIFTSGINDCLDTDINGDGKINAGDTSACIMCISNFSVMPNCQGCDFDENGEISQSEIIQLSRCTFVEGIDNCFNRDVNNDGDLNAADLTYCAVNCGVPECLDTCDSLGYECGQHVICDELTSCGNCTTGKICSLGKCVTAGFCSDSDGGKEYSVKGELTTNSGEYTDYCQNQKELVEFYCSGAQVGLVNYTCQDICFDGACIASSDISISIATLKDSYEIGESILLTEPPQRLSAEGVKPVKDESDKLVEKSVEKNFPKIETPTRYIVELEDEPLIIKEQKLEKQQLENKKRIKRLPFYHPAKYVRRFSSRTNVPREMSLYENQLARKRNDVQEDIQRRLGKNIVTGEVVTNPNNIHVLAEYEKAFNGFVIDVPNKDIEIIKNIEGIKKIHPDIEVKANLLETVPLIEADKVWEQDSEGNLCSATGHPCITGKDVTIAIIDTGVDYTHPDLGGCLGTNCKVLGGYDFVTCNSGSPIDCPEPKPEDSDPMDEHGHGTHVAATAAGNGVLQGVAPEAKLYAYRTLNREGGGMSSWILASIERAVDPNNDGDFSDHVDIISMSLGGSGHPDDALSKAIDNAVESGVVAVIAAGNSGPSSLTIGSPGTARKAITVGASYKSELPVLKSSCQDTNTEIDDIACFSSRGPTKIGTGKPDIVAPGVEICAAQWDTAFGIDNDFSKPDRPDLHRCVDERHVAISGTSMATPVVAGAAALMMQTHPDWSPLEIKNTLKGTAVDIGYQYDVQGGGRLDILSAVKTEHPYPTAFIDSSFSEFLLSSGRNEIRGTADSDNFQYYRLEYSLGDSEKWYLIRESKIPVVNGVLGHVSSDIESDTIRLRLIVADKLGQNNIDESTRYNMPIEDIKTGWPQYIDGGDSVFRCNKQGIVVADLDGDGEKEIITSNTGSLSSSGRVFVFSADGELKWANPVQSIGCSTPAVGNIDADPQLEVVHKASLDLFDSIVFGESVGHIFAWNHDGSDVHGWPIETRNELVALDSPALEDLDGDGVDEIIVQKSKRLHVLDSKGNTLWSRDDGDKGAATTIPTVIDVNEDGKMDVVQNMVNYLYAWSYDGKMLWKTPTEKALVDNIISTRTDQGVVIGVGNQYYSKDGNLLFYHRDGDSIFSDLDKDGTPEIIMRNDNSIKVFKIRGTDIEEYSRMDGALSEISKPVTGDINNDGRSEIVAVYDGKIGAWNMEGKFIAGYPKEAFTSEMWTMTFAPTINDVDNDAKLELLYILDVPLGTFLFVREFDDAGNNTEWPMIQHDVSLTGSYMDGYYTAKPQSKVVNHEESPVQGTLRMKLINLETESEQIVYEDVVTVPGKGVVTLGNLWSPNTDALVPGDYIVFAEFVHETGTVEDSWEFVVGCRDSDGGKSYFFKGNVNSNTNGGEDYCTGDMLTEYYCENGYSESTTYPCPRGCKDGKCNIICYSDSYCSPNENSEYYCNGSDSCKVSKQERCRNPGLPESRCVLEVSGTECVSCSSCAGGFCECESGQSIGDANGDGVFNEVDINIIVDIYFGEIPVPENICCVDATQDGKVNFEDYMKVIRISQGTEPSPGVC